MPNTQGPRIEVIRTTFISGTMKCQLSQYLEEHQSLHKRFDIPMGATIEIEVPGGGDWSGERIDQHEIDVVVTWKKELSHAD